MSDDEEEVGDLNDHSDDVTMSSVDVNSKGHALDDHHSDPHGVETDVNDTVFALKLDSLKVDDKKEEEAGLIDGNKPLQILYCPQCSMPPEYCEFNIPEVFEKCLPWILVNCKDVLSKALLAKLTGEEMKEEEEDNTESEKSSKRAGVGAKKKSALAVAKVIISRIQRQKKKYITTVVGLETVPDLKIKDAAKAFGKKFSSGASINETATGEKEVTIQGDCSYDLPAYLIKEFKVSPSSIFMSEDGGKLRPYEA